MEKIDVQTMLTIIGVLVAAIVALSASGMVGFFLVIRQNANALEKVFLSASPETQAIIRDIVVKGREVAKAVDEGFDIAEQITDGNLDEAAAGNG